MKSQKHGCGFPIARVVQVFSMATGAVTMMAMEAYAGKGTGETSLLRTLLNHPQSEDADADGAPAAAFPQHRQAVGPSSDAIEAVFAEIGCDVGEPLDRGIEVTLDEDLSS